MTSAWLAAAAAAVVELDVASFGQFMISRPIVVGPALGAGLGDLPLGAGFGVLCELFSAGRPPVGGCLPLNASVAVAAALLLALGPARVPAEAAFPAGLVVGVVHAKLEAFMRSRRSALASWANAALAEGRNPRLLSMALAELALQAAATFVVLGAALEFGGPLAAAFFAAPDFARAGLRVGLGLAPLLALASLMHSFRVVS